MIQTLYAHMNKIKIKKKKMHWVYLTSIPSQPSHTADPLATSGGQGAALTAALP
jgi:hypothetical protein